MNCSAKLVKTKTTLLNELQQINTSGLGIRCGAQSFNINSLFLRSSRIRKLIAAIKASQRVLITIVWYADEDEGSGGMPSRTKTSFKHT